MSASFANRRETRLKLGDALSRYGNYWRVNFGDRRLFGVSDGILDITRRSGMVRRIIFIYCKVLELIWKVLEWSGIFWKVLEGSRRKSGRGHDHVGSTLADQGGQGGAPSPAYRSKFGLNKEES